jgi:protein O-mannosyl-transferase
VILAAYSNHFHNSFHFDDSHTIEQNFHIRDLRNIPRFADMTTFSTRPANQTWRPIVSISLALDYKIAGALETFCFHVSTFLWFLVLLVLTSLLQRDVFDAAKLRPANRYIALVVALWFGLHPAVAETVNYIIQRADLYATLGVVGGGGASQRLAFSSSNPSSGRA